MTQTGDTAQYIADLERERDEARAEATSARNAARELIRLQGDGAKRIVTLTKELARAEAKAQHDSELADQMEAERCEALLRLGEAEEAARTQRNYEMLWKVAAEGLKQAERERDEARAKLDGSDRALSIAFSQITALIEAGDKLAASLLFLYRRY